MRYRQKRLSLAFLALLLCGQHATAQVNLPVLGDSVSGTISTQQEYEYGREFLRSVRKQSPSYNDPLIAGYISSLTFKLAANSELTDHRLEFLLIDSEVLNAFAAPGGIVGVNAGLFLNAQNEGQFASVLAHELAHLSQRHYARNVEQSRNSTLPNIAGLLAGLAIAAAAGGEAGQAALMVNQARGIDNQLRFSRSHEQEADSVGIRTLYNSGFNPEDMAGMFEGMLRSRSFSERPPEFMSTHPLDENRVADSRNRANSYPAVSHVQDPEFLLMRERVRIHYTRNPDRRPGSCGKTHEDWEARIVDPQGREVPVGEPGEIVLRPRLPSIMMKGYLNKPEETQRVSREPPSPKPNSTRCTKAAFAAFASISSSAWWTTHPRTSSSKSPSACRLNTTDGQQTGHPQASILR
jgi:predicted Zn-dependent protease